MMIIIEGILMKVKVFVLFVVDLLMVIINQESLTKVKKFVVVDLQEMLNQFELVDSVDRLLFHVKLNNY